jgi:thiamine-phosphate pyrophosphorylase
VGLPPLQAILDVDTARRAGWHAADLAAAFLDGGARFIQIRAKAAPSGPFLDLCHRVLELARPFDATIIVNDRVDLARMSSAHGVHVGQDDLPPGHARALLGDGAIVGCSTHDVTQVGTALREPVSYVAVGPVFGTRTKDTGYNAVGLELVTAAARLAAGLPVVAIGGIRLETAPAIWRAGATTVAVISDLLTGGDPAARVASYNRAALASLGG